MPLVNSIKVSDIHQGDLVFIRHLDKPYKTGWWRKVRCADIDKGYSNYGKVCYVLEIPVHKAFHLHTNDGSRQELDTYLMKEETVRGLNKADIKANGPKYGPAKYEILACVKGVLSVKAGALLTKKDSSLLRLSDFEDNRSLVTPAYEIMANQYFLAAHKLSDYQQLAEDLI